MYNWIKFESKKPDVPAKYTYIGICLFDKDYIKKIEENNHYSKKEKTRLIKQHKTEYIEQQKCIKTLEKNDIITLKNISFSLEDFLKNGIYYKQVFENFNKYYIIKIEPLNVLEKPGYDKGFHVNSFKIIKRFKTFKELLDQIAKDGLLKDFSMNYFYEHFYANKGYKETIIKYFKFVNNHFKEELKYFSFFQLFFGFTYTNIHEMFSVKEFDKKRREIVNEIFKQKLINFKQPYHWQYSEAFICQLIDLDLIDIAIYQYNLFNENHKIIIKESEKIKKALKRNIQNNDIEKLYDLFELKRDNFLKLFIYEQDMESYEDKKLIHNANFEDIESVKEYLIKEYDFSLKELNNKKINELEYYDDNLKYEFYLE